MSDYVPTLTLNPNAATEAAVQEVPTLEAITPEDIEKAKEVDISALSPAEQAAVREFSQQIDVMNTEQIIN